MKFKTRFRIPYFDLIVGALAVAAVVGTIAWHYSEVDDAREEGVVQQVNDTNNASVKTITEINDETDKIESDVNSAPIADTISVFTESIPTKDSGSTIVPEVHNEPSTDDSSGQSYPSNNESILYPLDSGIREIEKGVPDEVPQSGEPLDTLSKPPGVNCEQLNYDVRYGYIINDDCIEQLKRNRT